MQNETPDALPGSRFILQTAVSETKDRPNYNALETDEKVVFSLLPRPCTTAMIATEMPEAMRPYSMAVAPDSSRIKRRTSLLIELPPLGED